MKLHAGMRIAILRSTLQWSLEERSSISSATSLLEITKAKMASSSGGIKKESRKSNASVSTIRSDTSSSVDGPREVWTDVPT